MVVCSMGQGSQILPPYLRSIIDDRLKGLAARRLLDALGTARQAVISAQTQVKVAGPVYHGTSLQIHPRYFHAQGTLGEPGEPNWTRDRQDADKCVRSAPHLRGSCVEATGDKYLAAFNPPRRRATCHRWAPRS
jgi:hypothetical protein